MFIENISNPVFLPNSSDEDIKPTVVKRPRGRPAKYKPEEREQKYKELTKQWREENKERYSDNIKEYYEQHKEIMNTQKKEYQDRSREALRILHDIWESNDCIVPEHIMTRVNYLFQRTKQLIS